LIKVFQWHLRTLEKPGDREFFERLQDGGVRTPLDDEPELDSEQRWYFQAYGVLSRSRAGGFGPGPVRLSEIIEYWHFIARIGSLGDFVEIMQALDSEYLDHQAEKAKSNGQH
jgi:hypothetical protein